MRFAIAVLVSVLLPTYGAAGVNEPSLIEAVKAGDGEAVRTLLRSGVDVNAAEADGTTAMHWAAHNGDLQTVEALIRDNGGVNAKNRYGVAPLWLASTNGHADVVSALLRAGADPETPRAESGETPLMAAAMAGHIPVMQRLLTSGADPNVVDHVRQQTALMWAAAERQTEAARVLVEAGAYLESRSSIGMTPLMFAIRAGSIGTTMALLDFGGRPQGDGLGWYHDPGAGHPERALGARRHPARSWCRSKWQRSAWSPAARARAGPPCRQYWPVAGDPTSSHWQHRQYRSCEGAADARRERQRQDRLGESVLYSNSSGDQRDLRHDPRGRDTAVHRGEELRPRIRATAGGRGADPNIATLQQITPLLAAAGVGHIIGESPGTPAEAFETVKLLRSLGSALDGAVEFDTTTGVPVYTGWNGAGVLHGAVIRDAPELTKWLIAQGVPLDSKTSTGKMPLDLARGTTLGINFNMFPEVAEIIEEAMLAEGLPVPEHKVHRHTRATGRPVTTSGRTPRHCGTMKRGLASTRHASEVTVLRSCHVSWRESSCRACLSWATET